jgi:hypothetical protein
MMTLTPFDKFQRTVKEVGGMNGPRPDPLHLFENAHAVVPGLGPASASGRDDMIRFIFEGGRQPFGNRLEGLLGGQQVPWQSGEFGNGPVIVRVFTAMGHDGQSDEQRLQIEGLG